MKKVVPVYVQIGVRGAGDGIGEFQAAREPLDELRLARAHPPSKITTSPGFSDFAYSHAIASVCSGEADKKIAIQVYYNLYGGNLQIFFLLPDEISQENEHGQHEDGARARRQHDRRAAAILRRFLPRRMIQLFAQPVERAGDALIHRQRHADGDETRSKLNGARRPTDKNCKSSPSCRRGKGASSCRSGSQLPP